MPPSVNGIWIITKRGKRRLSEEARTFRRNASDAILEQRRELWKHGAPIEQSCRLDIDLYFKNRRSLRASDLDNRVKALQDALVKNGVLADDKLIDELFVRRAGLHKKPKTQRGVTIYDDGRAVATITLLVEKLEG